MTKPLLILIILITGCTTLSPQVKQAQSIAHDVQRDYRNEPDYNCIEYTSEIIRRCATQGIILVPATFAKSYHKATVWFDTQTGDKWVIDSTGAMSRWPVKLEFIYEETGYKLRRMKRRDIGYEPISKD